MTDDLDQLRETFEAHESPGLDSAAVYARVRELSRTYKRRRRVAQLTGTAVLGAGLVAGAIQLPSVLTGLSGTGGRSPALSAEAGASTSYTQAELEKDWTAYFAAGYGYNDAVQLAQLWHTNQNIAMVKADAGRRLLAGETLPVSPHPNPSAPVTSPGKTNASVEAFLHAGYTYDDAVQLAKLWHLKDPYSAKIEGGQKLLAGQNLPIKP